MTIIFYTNSVSKLFFQIFYINKSSSPGSSDENITNSKRYVVSNHIDLLNTKWTNALRVDHSTALICKYMMLLGSH